MCALELASDDPDVGVIVFTGRYACILCWRNFKPDESGQSGASAGFRKSSGGLPATVTGAIRNLRQGMNSSLLFREVPKPTIAVNGACAALDSRGPVRATFDSRPTAPYFAQGS